MEKSNDFQEQIKRADESFLASDITSICNILDLDYSCTVKDQILKISCSLCDLTLLVKKEKDDEDDVLAMKEIAARDNIEPEALMKHVIDGINDDVSNKVMLYGVTDMSVFREKLKVYEDVRQQARSANTRRDFLKTQHNTTKKNENNKPNEKTSSSKSTEQSEARKPRCYNCGKEGHKSKDCPHDESKCFKCDKFGRISKDCKGRSSTKVVPVWSFNLKRGTRCVYGGKNWGHDYVCVP